VTDSTAFDYSTRPRIVIPLPGTLKPGSSFGADDWTDVASDKPPIRLKPAAEDWSDVAVDKAPPPQRKIGGGEAAVRGAVDAASFGAAPALAGLTEAGKVVAPEQQSAMTGVPSEAPGLENIGAGLAGIFGNHPDPKAQEAYERGRQSVLADQKLAQEQHPIAFLAGQLGGALATPSFGAGTAGTLGARLATGAAAGAIGGTLYGAGSATSAGLPGPQIAEQAAIGGLEGGALGGILKGAIGARPAAAAGPLTAGQQAATTAAGLGTPLPRGAASDSRLLRGTTAAISSVPGFGARIHNALDATRQAAGEAVGQSGVDTAIAANKWTQNQLYNQVRGMIDPDKVVPMPRTAAAVAQVRATRAAARQANPDQGLEQFNNIASQGASFNGAQRARVDAREAGDVLNPNPGFNAADYNKITRAMTQDIRANLAAQGGESAVKAFEQAERNFGPLAEANKFLSKIARKSGPGAGLDEIGFNPATNEFSLDKFVTAWNKINPDVRRFVPAPGQVQNIRDIAQMGEHIKSSMRERNVSHTSNILILWDLARDATMLGIGAAAGFVSPVSVLGGAAGAVPAITLMHWLSSPANSATMAAWSRAYNGVLQNRTPARIAAFNIATRNMANTLGLDPAKVANHIATLTGSQPATAEQQQ
jgi:hypothetical protein